MDERVLIFTIEQLELQDCMIQFEHIVVAKVGQAIAFENDSCSRYCAKEIQS
jgi:hypothetical protein